MHGKRASCFVVAALLGIQSSSFATTPKQQQGGSTAILMQGWDWDSSGYGNPDWYTIMTNGAADMKALGITHVWFPPPADAAPGPGGFAQGYLPRQLNILNSSYGSETELQKAINAFKAQGIAAVADIVINHRVGTTGNFEPFTNPAWVGTASVVSNSGCGSDQSAPVVPVPGCGTGKPDTGWLIDVAQDLDHTNTTVANGIITYMNSLKSLGFTGLRYDYAPGYRAGFEESYTSQFAPDFCVAEVWNKFNGNFSNSNTTALVNLQVKFMQGDGASCTNSADASCGGGNQMSCGTFDYVTHDLMRQAIAYNTYYLLENQTTLSGPAGVIGVLPAMQVTFVDNHDTGPAETCTTGQNENAVPCGSVMQGYAYILTHPGIPTIFYPHVYDSYWNLRAPILSLVNARHAAGITSTSAVSVQVATTGVYAAVITGTKHQLAMQMGPTSWSPGAGWVLQTSGTNYNVWMK